MKDIDYDSLSFKQLLKYADNGDAWAQYLVGMEYAYPENDEDEDAEEAVKWFGKAYEAGVPEAGFELAQKILTGDGAEQDMDTAYEMARQIAEETDLPEAWALLGYMYGIGFPEKDMDKCRELMEKGAAMGSGFAQGLLESLDEGTLFGDGDDNEEEDFDEEADYEEEDDDDEEEGLVYDGTDGFPKNDYPIDVDRVTAEARRGNIHAVKTLAWGYYKGVYGLPENRKEGWKWYERGADMEDHWCLRELGVLYALENNGRKALKTFEKGIKCGSGDCCEKAGDLYFYGKAGISQDYHKAWNYYWEGHGMGHAGCIAAVATMCSTATVWKSTFSTPNPITMTLQKKA